jgi:hypothetical protein
MYGRLVNQRWEDFLHCQKNHKSEGSFSEMSLLKSEILMTEDNCHTYRRFRLTEREFFCLSLLRAVTFVSLKGGSRKYTSYVHQKLQTVCKLVNLSPTTKNCSSCSHDVKNYHRVDVRITLQQL